MALPKKVSLLVYLGIVLFAFASWYFDYYLIFRLGAYEGCSSFLAAPALECIGDSILQPSWSSLIFEIVFIALIALGVFLAILGAYRTGMAQSDVSDSQAQNEGKNDETCEDIT